MRQHSNLAKDTAEKVAAIRRAFVLSDSLAARQKRSPASHEWTLTTCSQRSRGGAQVDNRNFSKPTFLNSHAGHFPHPYPQSCERSRSP